MKSSATQTVKVNTMKRKNFDFDATIPTLFAMRMHGKELFLNFKNLETTLTCETCKKNSAMQ